VPTTLNFKYRLTPIPNAGVNPYLKISMVGAIGPNLRNDINADGGPLHNRYGFHEFPHGILQLQ